MPSSAEPVQPAGPTGLSARIFRLDQRDRRVARQRRRTAPPPLPADPTPEQRLAETMEALFLACGRTLTDNPTADAYRTTLDAVMLMLDGSLAEHLVGEDEHRHLAGMIQGMRAAPNEL